MSSVIFILSMSLFKSESFTTTSFFPFSYNKYPFNHEFIIISSIKEFLFLSQTIPSLLTLFVGFIFCMNFYSPFPSGFVQLLSHVWLLATPWTAAHQASLSFTISQSLPKSISIESVMLSNHLFLSHRLLLLPSVFSSIRVFSSESTLCIRWPKYWSFSFNISPSNMTPRTDFL